MTNDKDIVDNVLFLVEHHLKPPQYSRNKVSNKVFVKLINKYGLKKLELLSYLSEADITGRFHKTKSGHIISPTGEPAQWFRSKLHEISEKHGVKEGKIQPLITGHDLLNIGYKEGPKLGQILRDVQLQQEDGKLESKEGAIQYVKNKYQKSFIIDGINTLSSFINNYSNKNYLGVK